MRLLKERDGGAERELGEGAAEHAEDPRAVVADVLDRAGAGVHVDLAAAGAEIRFEYPITLPSQETKRSLFTRTDNLTR